MGLEIERKFLVRGEGWRDGARGRRCRQGYLCMGPPVAVRVRVMGEDAWINVKQSTTALTRVEFEYSIPLTDAEEMLAACCEGHPIDKTRHEIEFEGMRWEIDEFHGENAGLVVAELELEREDQPFARPPWLGEEVSGDARYLNTHLARAPFSTW